MNCVDSCGWLEYFSDGGNAAFFAPALEDIDHLIVPSICIYEVFKKILNERGENEAFQAVAVMKQGQVIDIDTTIAVFAAKLSTEHAIPMADSIVLAVARAYNAVVWTQDSDFASLRGVKYIEKTGS